MRLLSWNVLESSTTFSSVHTKISQKVTQLHVNKGINTFLWELLSMHGERFSPESLYHIIVRRKLRECALHSHGSVRNHGDPVLTIAPPLVWLHSPSFCCPAPFSCPQPFSTVLSLLSLNKPLLIFSCVQIVRNSFKERDMSKGGAEKKRTLSRILPGSRQRKSSFEPMLQKGNYQSWTALEGA